MRDVITASSESPGASGANSTHPAGRGAQGTTAAKGAGNGFGAVLDGYIADDGASGGSSASKRQTSGERHQNDGLTTPASTPVQAGAANPVALRWGMEQSADPGAATTAADPQNLASGSISALEFAALAQPARTAGALAWNLASPMDDPAAIADPAKGSRDATQALNAIPELAFGARVFPLEPLPPATGASAGSQEHSTSTDGTTRGAHPATPEDWQSGSENVAGPESEGRSSRTQGDGRTDSILEKRNTDAFTGIAAKGVASSADGTPGDRGESAGQTDTAGAWNMAGPAIGDGEAQPAAPGQEASRAGPAVVEPPEPAAQPASHDVSLHLADGDSNVDIRMAERAGEIRVTVHTPDRDLANSLRADLPDLVGNLRQSGFHAEVWRSATAAQSDAGRRNGSDGSPSEEHSPGGRRDGRQQRPQQEQPKDQSRWAGEWKSSLDPAQESHI